MIKTPTPIKMALIPLLILIVGCEDEKATAAKLKSGADLYEHYCAGCHLKDGRGQFLQGIPSLVENKMLNPTPLVGLQIQHKIEGKEGGEKQRKMPTFDTLSAREAKLIVQHIETL